MSLADRAFAACRKNGFAWLLWAGATDGIGTWSAHYTGKLACHLPAPISLNWRLVALSLLVGIVGSIAALAVSNSSRIGVARAVVAGILLGGPGIAGLHYVAMAAVVVPGFEQRSSLWIEMIAIVAGMVVASAGLSLSFYRREGIAESKRRHAGVLLRGLANPVMHYTAMAGISFVHSDKAVDFTHTVSIISVGLLGITIVPVIVLCVGFGTSFIDRLQKQESLLDELFEQAPGAIALMTLDHTITRVNREFTHLFGYSLNEAKERRLSDLIVPPEAREEVRRYTEQLARGERVNAEGIRQKKDGSRVHVSIMHVPVKLPGDKNLVYAIYGDVTDRKNAEEKVNGLAHLLKRLSHRLIQAQEDERRHLARELHDEIGQALTAAKLNLKIVASEVPAAATPRFEDSIQIIDRLLQQVRQLSLDLRPPLLDELGLHPALRWLADQQSQRTGLRITVTAHLDDLDIDPAIETACFRIAQEAITNAVRHSHAQRITVEVWKDTDRLWLRVHDDGAGFDVESLELQARKGSSFGLLSMKERASLMGGEVVIVARSGAGTEIRAWFPMTSQLPCVL